MARNEKQKTELVTTKTCPDVGPDESSNDPPDVSKQKKRVYSLVIIRQVRANKKYHGDVSARHLVKECEFVEMPSQD